MSSEEDELQSQVSSNESEGDDSEPGTAEDDSDSEADVSDDNQISLDESSVSKATQSFSEETAPEIPKKKSFDERVEEVKQRFSDRRDKSLFIRFPKANERDPVEFEGKVRKLSPLIVKVIKPRQKHARHCLVDFATKEDRDKEFKKLKKLPKDEKIVVALASVTKEEVVKKIVESRQKKKEKKKLKKLIKKEKIQAIKEKGFTSTIVIPNVPLSASIQQIKSLFPDAVDVHVKRNHASKFQVAAITLPSTLDARKAVKSKLSLGGSKLNIRFYNDKKNKKLSESNEPQTNDSEPKVPEPTTKKVKSKKRDAKKNPNKNSVANSNASTPPNQKKGKKVPVGSDNSKKASKRPAEEVSPVPKKKSKVAEPQEKKTILKPKNLKKQKNKNKTQVTTSVSKQKKVNGLSPLGQKRNKPKGKLLKKKSAKQAS